MFVDRLTGNAVQDANARIMSGLKANGLWTADVAASVKAAALRDVLDVFPKDQEHFLLGVVDQIIEHAIEKAMLDTKEHMNALV